MDEITNTNKELIISADVSEVNIVLLEDKQLVEFHKEQKNNNIAVGDVYLGRVKKILPGLNSAFIDIGSRKDAFLHYLDLGPQILSLKKFTKFAEDGNTAQLNMESFELEKDIDKSGKISDFIAVGEEKPITIEVPVLVTGHSEGVKMGGKLLVSSRKLRVSAMMNNLPDVLEVDSTHLMIGKQIVAGDLNYEGVTIVSPKATIICSVRPTRATQQAKMEQQQTGKKK